MTDERHVTPDETVDATQAGTAGTPAAGGGEQTPPPAGTPAADLDAAGVDDEGVEAEVVDGEVVDGEVVEAELVDAEPAAPDAEPEAPGAEPEAPEPAVAAEQAPGGFAAELEALRREVDERTRDVQRVTAEYANYRKRVERDRELIGQQATATVMNALLPVLDDLERAREHGEFSEGVAAVVDQLVATTAKFGLTAFGDKGDPFDPNRHEAVAHQTSADVSEPTCVDVLRRGYLLGDRLLRPAMVAVADPE